MASEMQVQQRGRMLMALTVLALLGVADGAWLTYVHVSLLVGASGAAQVCHALSRDGCSVTAGQYGDIAGIPISLIGMAGAAATFVVGVVAFRRRRESYEPYRSAAFVLAAISVAASVVMASLSAKEGSYCPFCVGWYGINLGLGVTAWLALDDADRRPGELLRQTTGTPLLAMVAAFCLVLAAGTFVEGRYEADQLEKRTQALQLIAQDIKQRGKTEIPMQDLPTSGPDDAEVVIVEVADFQCPYCRRLWTQVQEIKGGAGPRVQAAFIHYPLDSKCNTRLEGGSHELACDAAYAAECARNEDKFFEMGDLMFEHQPALEREDLVEYAGELGLDTAAFERCLDDPQTHAKVAQSIATAMRLEVRATPTFFINGYRFEGAPPEGQLAPMVEALVAADRQ